MNRIRGLWSGSGALLRSLSWLAGVLSTVPNLSWLDPGASTSDRAQNLALQTPISHQTEKRVLSTLWWSGTGKGRISCICCRMHCTSLCKPDISIAQAATLSSSNSALLPPIEHTNAFGHQEIHSFRYSELGFCSHTGLNLAHGTIATVTGDMRVMDVV
jgi:hypothetical protein